MNARDFCYWLQGYFELSGDTATTEHQQNVIKKHLAMVFVTDIDPSFPADKQKPLNEIHNNVVPETTKMRC